MTEELSAAVKDSDLEPPVNRRRPFDLHWRKAPRARQSTVDTVRRRQLTAGEICCAQCGSRPCPFDHDDEEQRKSHDVAFVGKLVAERNSLRDQLDEARAALDAATKEKGKQIIENESLQRQLAEKERNCRLLERERNSLIQKVSALRSRLIESVDAQWWNANTGGQPVHACGVDEGVVGDEQSARKQSSNKDFSDVTADSSSWLCDDEAKSESPRRWTGSDRLYEQFCRLRGQLADSRQRAAQLELQLAKTRRLRLDAAADNARLAERRDPAHGDTGMPCGDDQRRSAGARDGRGVKLNTEKRFRDAARRLEEAKARRALEDRLSTALIDLDNALCSRQKLADELAARDGELEELRRRQTSHDRDFRRHVELLRLLNETRRQNQEMRRKMEGGSGVITLSADGRLRRTVHMLTVNAISS